MCEAGSHQCSWGVSASVGSHRASASALDTCLDVHGGQKTYGLYALPTALGSGSELGRAWGARVTVRVRSLGSTWRVTAGANSGKIPASS